MKWLRELREHLVMSAVLYIIFGIILLIFPQTTAATLGYVLGGILILMGIGYIISYFTTDMTTTLFGYDLVSGLALIGAGAFVCWRVDLVIGLIPILLGLCVLISGVSKLQRAIDLLRLHYDGWFFVLIFSLLNIVIAAVLLFKSQQSGVVLMMLLGAMLIFSGLTDLITIFCISRRVKTMQQVLQEEEDALQGVVSTTAEEKK